MMTRACPRLLDMINDFVLLRFWARAARGFKRYRSYIIILLLLHGASCTRQRLQQVITWNIWDFENSNFQMWFLWDDNNCVIPVVLLQPCFRQEARHYIQEHPMAVFSRTFFRTKNRKYQHFCNHSFIEAYCGYCEAYCGYCEAYCGYCEAYCGYCEAYCGYFIVDARKWTSYNTG